MTNVVQFLPMFMTAMPEIFLAVMAMLLLILGVICEKKMCLNSISRAAIFILIATAVIIVKAPYESSVAFNGLFIMDGFASFVKLLILIGSALSIILSVSYLKRENMARFEYPVLILFATIGMMMMVSANDLMSLYMGLELQSLPLYVLAAMHSRQIKSSEAGIKYFVLGAISSGMLLYGASMIYGFTGTTQFTALAEQFSNIDGMPALGVIVGLIFMLAGMAFKISAVPFHMWTPDVYEGSPTPVTAFFAIVPKLAALAMMARLLMGPFFELADQWQQVIILISGASMILGAVAAVRQENIKRLMAYSSIGHMGYALIGLAAGSFDGLRGLLIYMSIYMVMSVGAFAVILMMCRRGKMIDKISDLAGQSQHHPMTAACLAILMFSMSGIPPLAGFFGKLFIFQSAISEGLYTLAVVGVLSSVVAAYYYLRIIKVMYFDEPADAFDKVQDKSLKAILYISTALIVLFIVKPSPLIDVAQKAASTLLAG